MIDFRFRITQQIKPGIFKFYFHNGFLRAYLAHTGRVVSFRILLRWYKAIPLCRNTRECFRDKDLESFECLKNDKTILLLQQTIVSILQVQRTSVRKDSGSVLRSGVCNDSMRQFLGDGDVVKDGVTFQHGDTRYDL